MKYVVFILVLIGSIFATYKITFSMTQEVMGALNIRTHIANHKVILKLCSGQVYPDTLISDSS